MICLWLVLPHAASSTSGRKMDLLLLFLTSHWQCVAAPSLELAIIFHLRKGIEKENIFWCVCILSIIQRRWHFAAAFFLLLLPPDNDVTQGSTQKQDGVLSSPPLCPAFLQMPVPLPGCTLLCGFSLCQPVIYRTGCIPQLCTALGVDLC